MAKTAKATKKQLPNAWVVSSKDRGRKKIKRGSKIYLTDKEEFEIELHNPTKSNVLAVINLDGKPISKTGLIIRRGERVYLDCFMDDKKKFLFETYKIDDTKESKDATSDNGILEVFFYNEKITEKYSPPNIIERHHYHHHTYRPYWYWDHYPYNTLITNTTNTTGAAITATTNDVNLTFTGSSDTTFCNTCTFDSMDNATSSDFTSLVGGLGSTENYSDEMSVNSLSIDTGQTNKGSNSDQSFVSVDMDFESYIVSKLMFKLLPESRKPKTKKDIKSKPKAKMLSDDILMLKELMDKGILDESEFSKAKAKLLA